MTLELREREVLSTLEKIKNFNFVLIGGYAVNSYTQPRFSVDCDLVVRDKEKADIIGDSLVKEGYNRKENNFNLPYGTDFKCFVKQIDDIKVAFDLLISGVLDRRTNARFSADWIFENSEEREVIGKSISIRFKVRVASQEALMVMKIAASRKSDLRDVFMLAGGKIDWDFVNRWLKEFNLKTNRLMDYISKEDFKDSLQGVFGKVDNKLFEKGIKIIKERLK